MPVSLIFIWHFDFPFPNHLLSLMLICRVSSDLEMSGNFDARRKSQGSFGKQEKSGKSEGILLCEIDFQPSEHPNFEKDMSR